MKRKLSVMSALILALALSIHNASANQKSYTIADWNATVSNPNFTISVLATPSTFTLNDFGQQTFNFFTITSNSLIQGTDINAEIDFSAPTQSVDIPENVILLFPIFLDITDFNNPQQFNLADRTFTVTLSEPSFWPYTTTTVTATIKQLSSRASVPDGDSTAMLLGVGLLFLAFGRRVKLISRIPKPRSLRALLIPSQRLRSPCGIPAFARRS